MPVAVWLASASLKVSEWSCPGATRPLSDEETPGAFEIAIARAGTYARLVGGRRVVVDPARMVCSEPDISYRLQQTPGAPARETVIAIEESCFRSLLAERDACAADRQRVGFPAEAPPLDSRAAVAHVRLLRAYRQGADAIALHESALALARHALAPHERGRAVLRVSPRAREAVEETRMTLVRRFAEPLTLEHLADRVQLTPWHLSRVFRDVVGESLHRYLVRIRLLAALERIGSGEPNLTRVALEAGFSSHSHFTSSFRRAYGASPSRIFKVPTRR